MLAAVFDQGLLVFYLYFVLLHFTDEDKEKKRE